MQVIMDCGGVVLSARPFKHNSRVPGPRLGLPVQGHLKQWAAPGYRELSQRPDGDAPACAAGDAGGAGSVPGLGKSPWRGRWQPAPVFLPGEFHGQRGLVGFSPRNGKESGTTQHTRAHSNVLRV